VVENVKDSTLTSADIEENIGYIRDYLRIDDKSISNKTGILHVRKATSYSSNVISNEETSFNNNSQKEQSFFVPSRTYHLTDTAS